ncbi:hypothetical protein JOL79_11465 [Microbispora sp. RL4-1S]|uniref:Uncharacterized protein n=1 Tax=Microbispora oryzae TaxID=2806554 RepID=A0A940WI70_9ACTN|nr:hypothetical protein [Microbispora oryzae]MBP2704432.1 hypothetical protein [Microbispora oryzae]
MGKTRIYFVPGDGELPVELGGYVSDTTFVRDLQADVEDVLPESRAFTILRAARPESPVTIRLRGRLTWDGYALLFPGLRHPHSRRVKSAYHRKHR